MLLLPFWKKKVEEEKEASAREVADALVDPADDDVDDIEVEKGGEEENPLELTFLVAAVVVHSI